MTNIAKLLALYPNDDSALHKFGELYRNEQGYEVWRIRNESGEVVSENVASDHDAKWLANSSVGGCDFADIHEDGIQFADLDVNA